MNWELFFQQIASGLATGSIYASLALALVVIYRTTEVINFAQGEMAMFSSYIAYQLNQWGLSFWPMFVATVAISFVGGVALERVVIRPVERAPVLTVVMVTIGLLLVLNGGAGWIWGPDLKPFPSPFPRAPWDIGGVHISRQDVGIGLVILGAMVLVWLFFRFTKTGLAMRGAALNPTASRLVGVRVSWMLALGWGFAAALGALSGMMWGGTNGTIDPNHMLPILIFAFAAAVLGGIESPVGAVVGGLALGVTINLLATYVHWVTPELELPVALLILLVILIVRPAGLFGRRIVRRV